MGLDLEKIDQIKTVTLVPVLRYVKGFEDRDQRFTELPLNTRTAQPPTGDGYMGARFATTEYPEYALTFTLG